MRENTSKFTDWIQQPIHCVWKPFASPKWLTWLLLHVYILYSTQVAN